MRGEQQDTQSPSLLLIASARAILLLPSRDSDSFHPEMGRGTRDDVARMGPPCLAQATSRRFLRALLLASTLSFGLPFACCADDGAGCTREDGAIASASGDRSNPRVGFAVPAREMSEAGLAGEGIGARPPPLVSFGAVEAGFKRNGDRGIDINKDLENNNRDRLNQKTATGSGAALGGDGGVAAGGSGGASSVGIASAGDSFISFTSKNSYPDITWSPWSHLAEPHRETTLRADSTLGDLDNDVFVWTMPGENGASFEGRYVVKVLDSINMYRNICVIVCCCSCRFLLLL